MHAITPFRASRKSLAFLRYGHLMRREPAIHTLARTGNVASMPPAISCCVIGISGVAPVQLPPSAGSKPLSSAHMMMATIRFAEGMIPARKSNIIACHIIALRHICLAPPDIIITEFRNATAAALRCASPQVPKSFGPLHFLLLLHCYFMILQFCRLGHLCEFAAQRFLMRRHYIPGSSSTAAAATSSCARFLIYAALSRIHGRGARYSRLYCVDAA